MNPPSAYYIPLHSDISDEARRVAGSFDRLYTAINSHLIYFVKAKFLDAKAAEIAAIDVTKFRNIRSTNGFYVEQSLTASYPYKPLEARDASRIRRPFTNQNFPESLIHLGNILNIPVGDFIPDEYYDLTHDMASTSMRFLPIQVSMHTSLQQFLDVFTKLEMSNVSAYHGHHPTIGHLYLSDPIRELHGDLVTLAKWILKSVLEQRPVTITISGKVREIVIAVDGTPTEFSKNQVRGIVSLALLKYDHWFSLKEFCKTAFAENTHDPKKQFDASLNVLKKYPPFSWDADEGIRRVNGAVIESLVDEAVLRAFLGQQSVL